MVYVCVFSSSLCACVCVGMVVEVVDKAARARETRREMRFEGAKEWNCRNEDKKRSLYLAVVHVQEDQM